MSRTVRLGSPDSLCPSVVSRRSETRRPFAVSVVFWLLGSWLSVSVGAQEPELEDYWPTSGPPETPVTLYGSGFAADFNDHWAFVYSPVSGLGAVLQPTGGTTSSWTGNLGPSADTFSGSLVFWAGNRFVLPGGVHVGETGVYLVQRAEWFVRTEVWDLPPPGTFTLTAPSPHTVSSELDDDTVVIEVPEPLLGRPKFEPIDLSVTIDGGQAPSAPVGGSGQNSVFVLKSAAPLPPARAFYLLMQNLEPKVTTAEAFARDLELVVEATFGALGVEVEVIGTEVHISWTGAPSVESAFAVLRWDP